MASIKSRNITQPIRAHNKTSRMSGGDAVRHRIGAAVHVFIYRV